MNIHRDFEELLQLFENHRVEYMIIGGYAVAFHGHPRFTKDIDIFFNASQGNIQRVREALIAFGFEESDLPTKIFGEKGNIVIFGVPPLRVDLLNDIDGLDFAEATPNMVRGYYGDTEVNYIGLNDLIKNKRATGRARDSADLDELTWD